MRRNKRRKSVYVCVLKAKSDDMTTASHYNFVCPSLADRLNDVAINKTLITILDDWFLNATQSTKSHRFFFCSLYVLLFCFVFLLFHEWIWYAFSILCYVELNAHDWPYHFCFLFLSAQMIYSICMLSASRAWNHNINDPYAKQMLERQSHKITLSHPGGDSAINFTHVSMLKCSLYYWYDAVADADDDDNNRTVLSAWQKRRHEYS